MAAPLGLVATLACFLLFLSSSSFAPYGAEAVFNHCMKDDLKNCIKFLLAKDIALPPKCCSGVKVLEEGIKGPEEQKSACECIKEVAGKTPAFRPDRVNDLIRKCDVKIPYEVFVNSGCR
ncbi:hypothetical protein H6P81_017281 [Aristolochia fimbriata]|uniref:Bifunctional inhibitor/plant lipid transfer protein/seed storage helical domain-containing protein n=1 Tax=Aristolochia fimbriata TaxID=158543 RepID=A0AAV7DXX0_ARIFI|nr:hypothetical protein H6P81_017281 [Aristolochia fimbriata]